MIGYTANNVLPARLGEVVRAYVLGQREGVAKASAFATIVFERVVDVFFLLGLLWLTMRHVSAPVWLEKTGLTLFVLNLVFLGVLFALKRGGSLMERMTGRFLAAVPAKLGGRLEELGQGFLQGLQVVGRRRGLVPIILLSFPLWALVAASIYFCFGALNLELPYMASVAVIVFVSLGSMIPSAPAYVGTTQYACVLALALFAVPRSEALAFSIVYHLSQFIPVTVLGFFFMWRDHIALAEAGKKGVLEAGKG